MPILPHATPIVRPAAAGPAAGYDCYFDRFQRFQAVAELLTTLRLPPACRLLDIGSLDNALAAFVPGHALTPWDRPVLSQTGGLPLTAGSFDVVLALDVLEHVPPPERPFFLAEMARVASRALVLSFPIAAAAAAEQFVLGLTGSAWLAEHQEFGLPVPEDIEALLHHLGLTFSRHPNACLPSWTAMMLLMHGIQDKNLRLTISAFFNRQFYALENREPAYRYIYLCHPAR